MPLHRGRRWTSRRFKEWVLLVCGLAGLAHEELTPGQPRPYLLLVYLAMMGLSAGLEDLLGLLGVSFNRKKKDPPEEP